MWELLVILDIDAAHRQMDGVESRMSTSLSVSVATSPMNTTDTSIGTKTLALVGDGGRCIPEASGPKTNKLSGRCKTALSMASLSSQKIFDRKSCGSGLEA